MLIRLSPRNGIKMLSPCYGFQLGRGEEKLGGGEASICLII